MRLVSGFPLLSVLIFILPINAHADQVILFNGDRISGEILYITDDEIQILTQYAGEICIDFYEAADLSTDQPVYILLKNGDIINGTIDSLSVDHMMITSRVFGPMEIPLELFEELERPETFEAESAELEFMRKRLEQAEADIEQKKREIEKREREIEKLAYADIWSGNVSLGVQLQSGNTDTTDVHLEASAIRKVPREELRLRLFADYGETEGETDTNKAYGETKLKVFPDTRWYLFGLTSMEYDEMEDLDLRAQVFGGPGYILIDREKTHLLAEIGAGLTGEFFDVDGEEDTLEPGVWLNTEWKQKLFERMEFFQALTLFPSISEFNTYRLRSETAIITPIGNRWAVKLSAIDEYDSDPEGEDVENNDFRLFSSIEYKF